LVIGLGIGIYGIFGFGGYWLKWLLDMATPGYGELEPDQIRTSARSDVVTGYH